MKKGLLLLSALAVAGSASANLITNGDFEAGNVGFTSQYTYVNPGSGNLYPESVYTVDTNANNSHDQFANLTDHTTGSGKYMIINGSGTANTNVWTATNNAPLVIGQEYSFSAWVANVHPTNPAVLTFKVNGVDLTPSAFSPTGNGSWQLFSASFIATGTSATFRLENDQLALSGNDFAVDDISVQAVPEPATMAVLGLGALGLLRRKRKG